MKKLFALLILSTQISFTAHAGFMPPPDDPYWCYEACIDPYYVNHSKCVQECYGDEDLATGVVPELFQAAPLTPLNRTVPVQRESIHTDGAACCSWESKPFPGCMPGC